ncbi:MAG: methylisocitrate lyase [Legionellales bacterium RIFCSPHIGHO2_12_FULL_42_9]|nr:MAG: methylisocitrate lyase [Legionellales bacterium RIFCSPHIGHO2_12_FULL_42_9]
MAQSQGKAFRLLIEQNSPLQIVGTINAYAAMLAQETGCKAIYLSGAGVANASYGLPDLGMTSLPEVLEDARRITQASNLPILVDIDTGWGHVFNIARTIKLMELANVAAIHIEDQDLNKRCGHRPKKIIVSTQIMLDRIKAAVDARVNPDFVIMARTDAYAVEGMNAALDRAAAYIEQGADMIFPEAMRSLAEYRQFCVQIKVPVLANVTEFGCTPLFTKEELDDVGIKIILYPLSGFRAMAKATLMVYTAIQTQGTQQAVLDMMQTREKLYDILGYREYEKKLDQIMEDVNG